MRRRNGFASRHRPRRWLRTAVLAAVVLLALCVLHACAVQSLVYSSSGTMVFIPK